MSFRSPRGSSSTPNWPGHDGEEYDYARMPSATPTPPRANATWYENTPKRPSTRAGHSRHFSSSSTYSPKPPMNSPRYNSNGLYSTDVSSKHSSYSSNRLFSSSQRSSKRERRFSYTDVRASPPYGDSDEDEVIQTTTGTYVIPASSRSTGYQFFPRQHDPYWSTNHHGYAQRADLGGESPAYVTSPSAYDSMCAQAAQQQRPPTSFAGHRRTSSSAVPPRSSTVKPSTQQQRTFKQPAPSKNRATPEDALRHHIPNGYSLKNWDPKLEPILVFGSVFDCNSLGKWIFDWVVHLHGNDSPFVSTVGDMWISMIHLYGKAHKLEHTLKWIRPDSPKRVILDEFDGAAERLKDGLVSILKACQAPTEDKTKRGANAGIEFVETLLDREEQLERLEQWMAKTRLWIHRYEVNCEPIVRKSPGAGVGA